MPQANKTAKPIPAKICYSHIGGNLGTRMLEAFVKNGWIGKISPKDKHYFITTKGKVGFKKIGVDISEIIP